MAKIIETHIDQIIPDNHNFNKHTEYGMHLLEKSVEKFGLGRSILLDKKDRIIGGNGVTEVAANKDLNNVIIVETDGTQLVAVRRKDIDLDTKRGREMALADNATGDANLEYDAEQIDLMAEEFEFDPSEWGVDIAEPDVNPDDDEETGGTPKYQVIIDCESEAEQQRIILELSSKYKCHTN